MAQYATTAGAVALMLSFALLAFRIAKAKFPRAVQSVQSFATPVVPPWQTADAATLFVAAYEAATAAGKRSGAEAHTEAWKTAAAEAFKAQLASQGPKADPPK